MEFVENFDQTEFLAVPELGPPNCMIFNLKKLI